MSRQVNINATRCAAYLNSIGILILPELAAQWEAQEKDSRTKRRAHNRELKKSCGHFRRHKTKIYSEAGAWEAEYCSDCHRHLGSQPLGPSKPPGRRKRRVA